MSLFGWIGPGDVVRELREMERRLDVEMVSIRSVIGEVTTKVALVAAHQNVTNNRLDSINGGFAHHERRLTTIEHEKLHEQGVTDERARLVRIGRALIGSRAFVPLGVAAVLLGDNLWRMLD